VLLAAATNAPPAAVERLKSAGVEILQFAGDHRERLTQLLAELGRRRMTNVLVEGGATLLGSFFDAGLVDEAHVFVAPKIAGGGGPPPVGGEGVELMADAAMLDAVSIRAIEGNAYFRGRIRKKA
jgi:diaminohydroxyphosphoribosylaminopyrimidine deaminase/5-amino-6-(5-phosphoribosylamino)uracil reductase